MPDSAPVMRTTGVVTSWFLHVRRPGQIACLGCRDHTFWDVRPKIYETENGMSNPAMTVGWWRGRCPQGAAATDAQGTTDPQAHPRCGGRPERPPAGVPLSCVPSPRSPAQVRLGPTAGACLGHGSERAATACTRLRAVRDIAALCSGADD